MDIRLTSGLDFTHCCPPAVGQMVQYSARLTIKSVWPIATNIVPQTKASGPPMSNTVEYKTTRQDQLHDIMI
jgi:hypothetical protein